MPCLALSLETRLSCGEEEGREGRGGFALNQESRCPAKAKASQGERSHSQAESIESGQEWGWGTG